MLQAVVDAAESDDRDLRRVHLADDVSDRSVGVFVIARDIGERPRVGVRTRLGVRRAAQIESGE